MPLEVCVRDSNIWLHFAKKKKYYLYLDLFQKGLKMVYEDEPILGEPKFDARGE